MKCLVKFSGIAALILVLASCANTKPLQYMQGGFDTAKLSAYSIPQPVIQQGDLLSIVVFSDNAAATALYNQASSAASSLAAAGGAAAGANSGSGGYLVDEKGNIVFQGLGIIHVEGITKKDLADTLGNRLKPFLTNAYFNIRFLNYKITVIGDVAKPATYTIPAEKVNLLEALGLAGDLNITARRDNVLIIREQNGKREFGRIDLTKPDIFTSPFYQLKQNDLVYVDLSKSKASANDAVAIRTISLATAIASTLAIIYSIIRK